MKPYYSKDGIEIFLGDCREVLPTLGPVDAVLTDPPWELSDNQVELYGNGVAKRRHGSRTLKRGEVGLFSARTVKAIMSACLGDCLVLCGYKELGAVCGLAKPLRGVFVWHKPNAAPARFFPAKIDVSFIVWTAKKSALYGWQHWPSMLFSVPFPNAGCISNGERLMDENLKAVHPCQGPLALYGRLLNPLPPTTKVVDPYMGTGTTLRAAKDLGRKAIGIEIEERYCEIAAKRLEQQVFQFSE